MVDNNLGCRVNWFGRIDARYYLIEMGGRYYIVNYSNPRDWRHYFIYFFPRLISQWDIYDVTGDERRFKVKHFWYYLFILYKITNIDAMIYAINACFSLVALISLLGQHDLF